MSWKKTLVWIWASVVLAFGTGCGITYNNDLPKCFLELTEAEKQDYAMVIQGVHERLRIQPLGDIQADKLLAEYNKDVDNAFDKAGNETPLVRQPTVNAIVNGVSAGRYELDMVLVFKSDTFRYINSKRRAFELSIANVKQQDAEYLAKAWGVREVIKQATIATFCMVLFVAAYCGVVFGVPYVLGKAAEVALAPLCASQPVSSPSTASHTYSQPAPRACR